MAKPVHAGKAAMNGYLSARWAAAGLTAGRNAVECDQGFGATLSPTFVPRQIRADASSPFGIEQNIFKFHAACYYVHSALDALSELISTQRLNSRAVASVEIGLLPELRAVCDIVEPKTGLEVKFSLRHLAAMTLAGIDTGDIHVYLEPSESDAEIIDLRSRITVVPEPFESRTATRVRIVSVDGPIFEKSLDVGVPAEDLEQLGDRLSRKFTSLAEPVVGADRAVRIRRTVLEAETQQPFGVLMRDVRGGARHA